MYCTLSENPVLEDNPFLQGHHDLKSFSDEELRYIILCFDEAEDNPYRKRKLFGSERKIKVIQEIDGVSLKASPPSSKPSSKKTIDEWNLIFLGKNRRMNRAIKAYQAMAYNVLSDMKTAYETAMRRYSKLLEEETEDEKKIKIQVDLLKNWDKFMTNMSVIKKIAEEEQLSKPKGAKEKEEQPEPENEPEVEKSALELARESARELARNNPSTAA